MLFICLKRFVPILWAIAWLIESPIYANSLIVKPSADTTIFEAFPDNNLGASDNMVAGANASLARARAVFRFDLSGVIPSNAIVQSVSLTVTVVLTPPDGGEASTFDLRRVLVDWGEGTGTNNSGVTARAGEANWSYRFYPSNSWSLPGGTLSNDFSELVSASLYLPGLGAYTVASTSNLVSDVQDWVNEPARNFGWVFMSEAENVAFSIRRIGTRENVTNAPLLRVDFLIPEVPVISFDAASQVARISFVGLAGESYSVQYQDSLAANDWMTLTNTGVLNVTTNISLENPLKPMGERFYRVVRF